MRLTVELEDGKKETGLFVPSAAAREAQNSLPDDASSIDILCFCGWWVMNRRGLLPIDVDWEQFSEIAAVSAEPDTDPKA